MKSHNINIMPKFMTIFKKTLNFYLHKNEYKKLIF